MTKKLNNLQNFSFTKMQALGNDFIVVDGTQHKINLHPQFIQQIADRHFGIGFDQLLLLESSQRPKTDFYYRIFNADGTEVAQCGNGARCIARFAKEYGLTNKKKLTFETYRGIIQTQLLKNNLVCVNMGFPEQKPDKIPFVAKSQKKMHALLVKDLNKKFNVFVLSLGNPHCILWVDTFEEKKLQLQKVGYLLSTHPSFPEGANVSFVKVLDRNTIELRVFERGVGETLACGSAACAAMVASRLSSCVDNQVNVRMKGGSLKVSWKGGKTPVWLTGPAEFVFSGNV